MRPTPARSAIVTRITPDGATLARLGGAAVPVGATVVDGEALIIATPTGDGGGVTLDRRGVALRLTTARLPPVTVSVTLASSTGPASVEEVAAVRAGLDAPPMASVYESRPRVSADPVLPLVGSVGVRGTVTPRPVPAVKHNEGGDK